jgi:hypothetical protein
MEALTWRLMYLVRSTCPVKLDSATILNIHHEFTIPQHSQHLEMS